MAENNYTLSDAQRQVLDSAVREGYFKVPREASLVELSEQTGLSDKEVSVELRRALEQLLREDGFGK